MASIVAAAGTLAPLNVSSTPRRSYRRYSTSLPNSSAAPFLPQIRCSVSPTPNSSTENPKFPAKSPFSLPRTVPLALTALSVGSGFLIHLLAGGNGGLGNSGGGNGGGGGGGGGSGGGDFFSRLQSYFVANAKEDESQSEWDPHGLSANVVLQMNKLSGFKKYKVSDVVFVDKLTSESIGSDDSFNEMVTIRPGGIYTKAQLQKELETLATCGMFEKVDIESTTKPDGTIGIAISFVESSWSVADRFKCINVGLMAPSKTTDKDPMEMSEKERMEFMRAQEREYKKRMERSRPCMLPASTHREILDMLAVEGQVTARLLQKIRDKVQRWYHDNGYVCAQVVNFGNLNTREVVCEVVEGDITQVVVQFQDKLGNVCEGNTQFGVVRRELPKYLRQGKVFNIEGGKQALRNINSLALFSNIEVNPRPDEKNEGGIVVEIKLKELEQQSAEVSTEWSIVPGRGGRPTLASIQPGGTVSFEHRNLKGLNRSLLGSVTTSNFLNPQDDLAFKLEYVHPYLDGLNSSRNRTLRTSCFNSRKLSPVFTGGPGMDEVPPIWVDRAGIKTNITESFTRQSKFTYGIVMEEITKHETVRKQKQKLPDLPARARKKMQKTAQAWFSGPSTTGGDDLPKQSPSLLADWNAYAAQQQQQQDDLDSADLPFDLEAAVRTANNKVSGTFNVVSKGVRDLPGSFQSNVPSGKSLLYFGLFLAAGVFFIFISFTMFLPVMMLMPQKFAICFTIGCAFIIGSFFALKGPRNQLAHMSSKERLPFTLGFLGSMVGTIYVSMVLHSYVLSALFSVLQVLALSYYALSYFPGGSAGLKFLSSTLTSSILRCFGR